MNIKKKQKKKNRTAFRCALYSSETKPSKNWVNYFRFMILESVYTALPRYAFIAFATVSSGFWLQPTLNWSSIICSKQSSQRNWLHGTPRVIEFELPNEFQSGGKHGGKLGILFVIYQLQTVNFYVGKCLFEYILNLLCFFPPF